MDWLGFHSCWLKRKPFAPSDKYTLVFAPIDNTTNKQRTNKQILLHEIETPHNVGKETLLGFVSARPRRLRDQCRKNSYTNFNRLHYINWVREKKIYLYHYIFEYARIELKYNVSNCNDFAKWVPADVTQTHGDFMVHWKVRISKHQRVNKVNGLLFCLSSACSGNVAKCRWSVKFRNRYLGQFDRAAGAYSNNGNSGLLNAFQIIDTDRYGWVRYKNIFKNIIVAN